MTDSLTGGCFCGAIRYALSGELRNLCLCHCESCRRASGAPFVAWGSVDPDRFRLLGGELALFESSPGVERGHCGTCGTTITYRTAKRSHDLDIALATLDDPEALQPRFEIFTKERLHWVPANDELKQFATVPGTPEDRP